MVVLYEHPLSPYSQKCRIALAEKGVPFELRLPERFGSGATNDAGFIERNPRHEVPVLVDGDARIFDSTIILEYIEEKWPQPALLPRGPDERARARMIEDVMDTQYEAINWGIMEIARFRRASGNLRDTLLARAREQTGKLGHHKVLNCFGWKPPRCGILPPRLHQALRDVIAVADPVLDRMTWRKTVPGLVIEKSGKKTGAMPLAFPDGFFLAPRSNSRTRACRGLPLPFRSRHRRHCPHRPAGRQPVGGGARLARPVGPRLRLLRARGDFRVSR